MDDTPLLSVLCLTFNHEPFVADALASIVAQQVTFAIEVVVADDCSSDRTLEVVEGFRHQLGQRLHVLTTPVNLGVTRNFRRALAACRGRYVALCEGDDHWRGTSKLRQQVEFLELHQDYVLTFHDATLIGETNKLGAVQVPWRFRRDAKRSELLMTRPISTVSACFRNVLSSLPFELDQAPALDLCLWSLLGQYGRGRYMKTIEPAAYRVHSGGIFSTEGERARYIMTAQSLLCLARMYARLGDPALGDKLLLHAAVVASQPLNAAATMKLTLLAPLFVLLHWMRALWVSIDTRKAK